MADDTRETIGSNWVWWVLGLVVLALALIWLFSGTTVPSVPNTGTGATTTDQSTEQSQTNVGETTVGAITQDPSSFDNASVTVTGTVQKLYGTRLMIVTESGAVGGRALAVVSPRQITAAAGDSVTVSGVVHAGTLRDLLSQYGIGDPSDSSASQKAVIVANSITMGQGSGASTSSSPSGTGGGSTSY